MEESSVHRQRRDRNQAAGDRRRERVSGGVEGASIKSLCGPEHQGRGEPKKVSRRSLRVRENEVSARKAVYQVDQREGGRHHQTRRQERSGSGAVDGSVYRVSKLLHAFFAK